jgi:hypothetical protein
MLKVDLQRADRVLLVVMVFITELAAAAAALAVMEVIQQHLMLRGVVALVKYRQLQGLKLCMRLVVLVVHALA